MEGAASALETRYVTCDLRRATHRYSLTRRFCTYVYVDFLPIQIHSRPLTIRPLCSEGVAERRTGRSKG